MTPAGFPHSDIPGSKSVCDSPRLIAAYHVLHRLLVPRHPPCALSSLTGNTKVLHLWLTHVSYSVVKEHWRRASASRAMRANINSCASRYLYMARRACAAGLSRVLVEIAGLEPAASGLQSRRSPS